MGVKGLKDRALQDYYERIIDMCSSPGWRYFMEDVQKLREAAENIRTIKAGETVDFRKGQLDIIDWLTARADTYSEAYEALLVDEDYGSPD